MNSVTNIIRTASASVGPEDRFKDRLLGDYMLKRMSKFIQYPRVEQPDLLTSDGLIVVTKHFHRRGLHGSVHGMLPVEMQAGLSQSNFTDAHALATAADLI